MHLEPSARGRRAYDAGVNIVPYIDMLMTLMIFLMVTAVWTHTRALPAENTSGACTGPACGPGAERVVARLTASGIDVGDRRFAADDVERAVRALKGGGGLDVRWQLEQVQCAGQTRFHPGDVVHELPDGGCGIPLLLERDGGSELLGHLYLQSARGLSARIDSLGGTCLVTELPTGLERLLFECPRCQFVISH